MSKRKFLKLIDEDHVAGWDDPRMPTLAGMRRRGYTPQAIRNFCEQVGISKYNSVSEFSLLEFCVRKHLNDICPRVMCVLKPLRVVIENYPADQTEELDSPYHPQDPEMGSRKVPFSRVLYLEQDDFQENPVKKFFRLAPGREVRLRYAYFITCTEVVKDQKSGEIVELRCTYAPETRGGSAPDGRKVKATLHWVSADHAVEGQARLYEHLFSKADPEQGGEDFLNSLNPDSLVDTKCYLEASLAAAKPGSHYQFERLGYFCTDLDSKPQSLIFNRTVTLRDTWAKVQKQQQQKQKQSKKNKSKNKGKK